MSVRFEEVRDEWYEDCYDVYDDCYIGQLQYRFDANVPGWYFLPVGGTSVVLVCKNDSERVAKWVFKKRALWRIVR